jgi:hypothetical protein
MPTLIIGPGWYSYVDVPEPPGSGYYTWNSASF